MNDTNNSEQEVSNAKYKFNLFKTNEKNVGVNEFKIAVGWKTFLHRLNDDSFRAQYLSLESLLSNFPLDDKVLPLTSSILKQTDSSTVTASLKTKTETVVLSKEGDYESSDIPLVKYGMQKNLARSSGGYHIHEVLVFRVGADLNSKGFGVKIEDMLDSNKKSHFSRILVCNINGTKVAVKFPTEDAPFNTNVTESIVTNRFVYVTAINGKDINENTVREQGGFWIFLFSKKRLIFICKVDFRANSATESTESEKKSNTKEESQKSSSKKKNKGKKKESEESEESEELEDEKEKEDVDEENALVHVSFGSLLTEWRVPSGPTTTLVDNCVMKWLEEHKNIGDSILNPLLLDISALSLESCAAIAIKQSEKSPVDSAAQTLANQMVIIREELRKKLKSSTFLKLNCEEISDMGWQDIAQIYHDKETIAEFMSKKDSVYTLSFIITFLSVLVLQCSSYGGADPLKFSKSELPIPRLHTSMASSFFKKEFVTTPVQNTTELERSQKEKIFFGSKLHFKVLKRTRSYSQRYIIKYVWDWLKIYLSTRRAKILYWNRS